MARSGLSGNLVRRDRFRARPGEGRSHAEFDSGRAARCRVTSSLRPGRRAAASVAEKRKRNSLAHLSMKISRSFFLFATMAVSVSTAIAQEAPKRPRILGISHAAFYVTDMAKARAFYEGLF